MAEQGRDNQGEGQKQGLTARDLGKVPNGSTIDGFVKENDPKDNIIAIPCGGKDTNHARQERWEGVCKAFKGIARAFQGDGNNNNDGANGGGNGEVQH